MLKFTFIGGHLHMAMQGDNGRTLWVPVSWVPRGSGLHVPTKGKQPLLRALSRRSPQRQACKLPANHVARIAANN